MLHLLLMKYEQEYDIHAKENKEYLVHWTDIIKYLTLPWANSECGVCADSYFYAVSSAEEVIRLGLQIIGIVKTSTKKSHINYLSVIELTQCRGQKIGVFFKLMWCIPWWNMFGWIMIRDTLSQLHHQYQKARRTQRFSREKLTYQRKTLVKRTIKKKVNKSFMCHSWNVPKYTIIHVKQLTNITVTDKILYT